MDAFDVVLVGDFRFPGGTSSAVAHELRALAPTSLNIGLIQHNSPVLKNRRHINRQIKECVDAGMATLISADARTVRAGVGIFHNPLVFESLAHPLPSTKLDRSMLVVHQGPADRSDIPYYDVARVAACLEELCGAPVTWAPISPIVRRELTQAHPGLPLSPDDWHNIIFLSDWEVERDGRRRDRPIIGRHSRPEKEKWPATRAEVLEVYPDDADIEVHLLGAGAALTKIMGEIPARWTTYKFNQVPVADFLAGIDFFVYYHHPHWVEAFGRTVAEAIASGAIPILPPYFEYTFEEAAFYTEPQDAIALVQELHGDPKRCKRHIARAQRLIAERHGPEQYVRRIARLLGRRVSISKRNRGSAEDERIVRPKAAWSIPMEEAGREPGMFDIVTIGDMRTPRDAGVRIAWEAAIQSELGYRTGLLHVPAARVKAEAVRPEIHAVVRRGDAEVIAPEARLRCRLAIIYSPESIFDPIPESLPAIDAENVAVIADGRPEKSYSPQEKHRILSAVFRAQPVWHPTCAEVRQALIANWPDIPLHEDDWLPAIPRTPWRERNPRPGPPIVGLVHPAGDATNRIFDGCQIKILQETAPKEEDIPGKLEFHSVGAIAVEKFLDSLDFLLLDPETTRKSDLLVAYAMSIGVIPVAPPDLKEKCGGIGLIARPDEMPRKISELVASPEDYTLLARQVARTGKDLFSASHHGNRLSRIIGRRTRAPVSRGGRKERVAFVSSNGVGLGHLTRLLAIARRMPEDVQPLFITMSQAFGIVEQFGFPAEYIPFHGYGEMAHVNDWNDWFKLQFEHMLDAYDVRGVVFDGGAPYGGLIRAMAPRPELRTVWIRRGMWREGQFNEPLLRRQKFFDMIIEPREIAGARDAGLTVAHRGSSRIVDPIRLLDAAELLDRATAAKHLGLDPGHPAVLIQLGAGSTRDIVNMTRRIVDVCRSVEGLQIVIAEWAIGAVGLDYFPGVKVLRGYPISRYFRAFDFTISAAGYNSFNEILSFGLPAIFIANSNPIMDDQDGRADFAQEQGASFSCRETELEDLAQIIPAILDPSAAAILRFNAARISLANGAEEAAALVSVLVRKGSDLGSPAPLQLAGGTEASMPEARSRAS